VRTILILKEFSAKAADSLVLLGDISCFFNNPIIAIPVSGKEVFCTLKYEETGSLSINGLKNSETAVVKLVLSNLKLRGALSFVFEYPDDIKPHAKLAAALLCITKLSKHLGLKTPKTALFSNQFFSTIRRLPFVACLISSYLNKPVAVRIREGFITLNLTKSFKLLYIPLNLPKPRIFRVSKFEDIYIPITHALGHISIAFSQVMKNGDLNSLFDLLELESKLTLSLLENPYMISCALMKVKGLVKAARYSYHHHALIIPYVKQNKNLKNLMSLYSNARLLKVSAT